ncbi:MAG: hypothetical protein OEV59_04525 [Deltaproteobacteria bacterium]|nr:hypothetical protein [Deltaproteobacteria bacterium]
MAENHDGAPFMHDREEEEQRAIDELHRTLGLLTPEARARVIVRLIEEFSLEPFFKKIFASSDTAVDITHEEEKPKEKSIEDFSSVSDISAFAVPKTITERTLVIAAYLQLKRNEAELSAYDINKELEHTGHKARNITSVLTRLSDLEPPLIQVIQIEHSKHKYRVTAEGIEKVRKMLTEFPSK